MTTGLLERVKFLGGGGGAGTPEPEPLPLEPPAPGMPLLDPDPAPAPATREKRSKASAETAKTQTRAGGRFVAKSAVQKQMADELNAYAKMLALTWSMTDEPCAAVLNDTSEAITRDLAALMARSEWVVEKFQSTSLIGDCLKLLHSLFPLLRAIWQHHGMSRGDELPDDEPGYDPVTVADPVQVDPAGYAPWRPTVVPDAV